MSLRPTRDDQLALKLVMDLMAIEGKSGEEGAVADYVIRQLRRAGAEESMIQQDTAHRRSPYGGEAGNVICKLPGTRRGPRCMLSAHLDTVPICVGARPVRKGNRVTSAARHTGLGADNRAGTAVLLATAITLLKKKLPHPPITLLWTVQEEVGLAGIRNIRRGLLGRPRRAFNFDGGSATKLTIGATGASRLTIHVNGVPSHAGVAPQDGVSAIAIAAMAIAELHEHGWHGQIRRNGRLGTSNVGILQGGEATNVVTDKVLARVEARSHDSRFRKQIVTRIERAFRAAAKKVRNAGGRQGSVTIEQQTDYEAYHLARSEPSVQVAAAAVRAVGQEPEYAIASGGLDANWITAYGFPCVSLGCGQRNIHTADEELDIEQFLLARRIAIHLVTDAT